MNEWAYQAIEWLSVSGLKIGLIVVLAILARAMARLLANRLFRAVRKSDSSAEGLKRIDTLGSLIKHILSWTIVAIALIMVLDELGVEIGPVLAAAGILGLAIGFGAQQLVQDIIGGFFILMEDQIRVGDVVEIAGKSGLVERVNLRMVVLRDLAGSVHYVRNGQISTVTNMTREWSRYVFEVGVAYRENVDEVIGILKEIDEELRADPEFRDDILKPLEVLGLDQFADSALIIKAFTTTRPIQQWRIGREFNRRLKIKFDEKNIEIPFPHITMYMGEDKQGLTQSLNVEVKGKAGAN
ncbi:MAG: mechanosensitive ion channel family protein [Candidatus Zixiibacteriota bacterium]|nr:MAG: mechanosensitive ion channel family protein [candidate division Zixibacteria bacterium]